MFNTSNFNEDRLYTQVKGRKSRKGFQKHQLCQTKPHHHHQEHQQQHQYHNDAVAVPPARFPIRNESQGTGVTLSNQLNFPVQNSIGVALHFSANSNIRRLLESTIPVAPAHYFSKTTMRCRRYNVEYQHFFALSDLWDYWAEWSAYGAGVPLRIDGNEGTTQYYAPFLSAIRLFGVKPSAADPNSRQAGEDSDSSSVDEFEEDLDLPKLQRNLQGLNQVPVGKRNVSPASKGIDIHKVSSSDDSDSENSRGHLLFEYFERDSPYYREPLSVKIASLSCSFPELYTLRSCDLHPSSWISVAWYPIYKIPSGTACRDLEACFLTYHHLSVLVTGAQMPHCPKLVPSAMEGAPTFVLPAFGAAFSKISGPTWHTDYAVTWALMQSTAQWLKTIGVTQPDMKHFLSHSAYHRSS